MVEEKHTEHILRIGIFGTVLTAFGIVLSGPLGLAVIQLVQPQPGWIDAKTFVENYHPIQTFPFFAGFALVLGYVVTMAALYRLAEEAKKPRLLIAVILTSAFAMLIIFNYINQTTFIPALVRTYEPEYDPLISAFSFSNPNSLCWAIEMWGYALLGLATWCAAAIFNRDRLEQTTARLMILNGVLSVASAVVVSFNLEWVFTDAGLASYAVWNVLVFFIALNMVRAFRRRQRAIQRLEA